MGHPRLRQSGAFLLRFIPFALAFAAAPAWLYWETVSELDADKKEWTIAGPPCPAAPHMPVEPADGPEVEKHLSYGGVSFTYRMAMAYCAQHARNSAWPSEKYVVCQFNNPGAVAVSAGRSRAAFLIPPGQRATVTSDREGIRCVVGGWFRI